MKKTIKWIISLSILCILTIICAYILIYILINPTIQDTSFLTLYDNTESVFYDTSSSKDVSLEEVSPYFLDAIVAIEDHRFYSHYGFDIIGIFRAIYTNISELSLSQGASTLSQQYARLVYLDNDKTWTRKIKEAIYTIAIETHYDKAEILEGYINEVYFGHGVYGIKDASYYYFQKEASELTLEESAMLAGVVNGPSYYSPLIDYEAATNRQTIVLDRMLELEYIDQEQYTLASQSELVVASENELSEDQDSYYYRDLVLTQLEELGYDKDQGYEIYTTLDPDYQSELIQSTSSNTNSKVVQTASIVVEPYTSKILALMGGNDYSESTYNRALYANRQIGSTIKPFLYYVALENGFDATTSFLSEPTTFILDDGNTYTPQNYNNIYAYQNITLAQAIAVSDNIYAMKTHLFLGVDYLTDFLELFHYDISASASLALGTLNTNVYDLANVYNTLASEGAYQEIYCIEKIIDSNGTTVYVHRDEPVQLLDQDSCLILAQLLTGTFDSQFNTYLSATLSDYTLDGTYAAKTGTTDYDSLTVGYNPSILTITWVGYDDNLELDDYSDRVISKSVVIDMLEKNASEDASWYTLSDTLEAIMIDPLTGLPSENGTIYWFKK
ncbi:transglycosylase domain-containing protein [Tannockella kyphosi]|uniref:transglycosylase domain-containing protein n=1 Tax=Tannockella kyphosi TaxID=2899121 RepID=UPI0020113EB6|nr:transglycosylase domain-containing protein [Tannockella kyphosi]